MILHGSITRQYMKVTVYNIMRDRAYQRVKRELIEILWEYPLDMDHIASIDFEDTEPLSDGFIKTHVMIRFSDNSRYDIEVCDILCKPSGEVYEHSGIHFIRVR